MVFKHFRKEWDIDKIISELSKTETVQYAVAMLHILGDLSIGLAHPGLYADYNKYVVKRIKILMFIADMETPYYSKHPQGLKDPHYISWEDQKVQEKAARILATLLGKVNKRHGDYNYDEDSEAILKLPMDLIIDLVKFYTAKNNIPTYEPARKEVSEFLELVYKSILLSGNDDNRLRPFYNVNKLAVKDKQAYHKLLIVPLILIGKTKLFLHDLDFTAINELEWYIHSLTPIKVLDGLNEALVYWLAESKRKVNNKKAQQMLDTCEVCMLLMSLKQVKEV